MAARRLEKRAWRAFFDGVSKALVGETAVIETASLALGDQVEAAGVPLLSIGYDPKKDTIEVFLRDLDHRIDGPQEIYIDTIPDGLMAFQITDRNGFRHIIQLRDPLMLRAPSKAG
jgi:hypothetical protein